MIFPRLVLPWLALICLVVASACGGGQTRGHPLDLSWSDEDGHELSAFVKEWKPPRPRAVPAVVVGVVDDKTLIGRALDQDRSWRFEHELEGRPLIAGSVVVGIGGGYLFALDARSGDLLWERKALGKLRGGDDDGSTTIVSIASLSAQHSVVLAIARDGSVIRQIYEKTVIGRPAVLSSFAFLPYDQKWVLIFDLIEGHEVARVVSDQPISHAFLVDGALLLGEQSAIRFDANIVAARRGGGSRLSLPTRHFPGQPYWLRSGAIMAPTAADRRDLVRFHVRPEIQGESGAPRIRRYLLSYHRLAVGLDGRDGSTRWVHTSDELLLDADAAPSSYLLCGRGGTITWIDATDAKVLSQQSLDEQLIACVAQAGSSGPPPKAARPSPGSLATQLVKAIGARGPGMLAMQLVLLEDLAGLDDEKATQWLVRLAGTAPSPQEPWNEPERHAREALRDHAAALLAKRRRGGQQLRQLLREAAESTAPFVRHRGLPVGAMARALASIARTPRASRTSVVALAPFLHDPTLPEAAQAEVATAVALLADRSASVQPARRALTSFLARHACAADDRQVRRAMPLVADRLIQLGASEVVRRAVRAQTQEGCEDQEMRGRLYAALEAAGLSVYGSRPRLNR